MFPANQKNTLIDVYFYTTPLAPPNPSPCLLPTAVLPNCLPLPYFTTISCTAFSPCHLMHLLHSLPSLSLPTSHTAISHLVVPHVVLCSHHAHCHITLPSCTISHHCLLCCLPSPSSLAILQYHLSCHCFHHLLFSISHPNH